MIKLPALPSEIREFCTLDVSEVCTLKERRSIFLCKCCHCLFRERRTLQNHLKKHHGIVDEIGIDGKMVSIDRTSYKVVCIQTGKERKYRLLEGSYTGTGVSPVTLPTHEQIALAASIARTDAMHPTAADEEVSGFFIYNLADRGLKEDFEQGSAEWLELRKRYITGSKPGDLYFNFKSPKDWDSILAKWFGDKKEEFDETAIQRMKWGSKHEDTATKVIVDSFKNGHFFE